MRKFFLGLVFCTAALHASELQVISKTPFGRTESATTVAAITATFNQPMVNLDAPAQSGMFCPIMIEPAVKGRCRWQGTQVLSFEPERPLPPATLYKVKIPAGTASRVSDAKLSSDETWTFETRRPEILTSKPTDHDKWVDLNPTVVILFNLDMDWKRAAKFMTLEETPLQGGDTTSVALAVRQAKPDDIKANWPYGYDADNIDVQATTSTVLVVKPARPLQPDHAYRLIFAEGLPAAEGTLGLLSSRTVNFETWYGFRFLQAPMKKCLPQTFQIAFSNPMKMQTLLDHMKIMPSTVIPALEFDAASQTGQADPLHRQVVFDLPDLSYQPNVEYHFTIDADLQDIFGNRLGAPVSFTLSGEEDCPALAMPEGWSVIESYFPPRHAVDVVNMTNVPLEMARIDKNNLIPFYRQYFQTYNEAKCDLPSPLKKTWQPPVPRNHRWRTFVDLNQVLHGQGGFVASQLVGPDGRWSKAVDDVTRIGITLKSSPDTTLIWTSYLKSGAPALRVPVEIRGDDNQVKWTGLTDSQGFAPAPGWKKLGIKAPSRYQRPILWVFAMDEKGVAALSSDQRDGIEPWRFNIPYDWSPGREDYRVALFTERGVYRPGETVYLKGAVRKLENGDWQPSDIKTLEVHIDNSRDTEVFKTTVTLSAQSTFDLAYPVSAAAPTGYWRVAVYEMLKTKKPLIQAVHEGDDAESENDEEAGAAQDPDMKINGAVGFRVEAFKPASFEVHATPLAPSFIKGDMFSAVVDGWYLFGAPMVDAPVEWNLRLEPGYFAPSGFDDYDFSPGWWDAPAGTGQLLASNKTTLDDKGKAPVSFKLPTDASAYAQTAVLEASVTSPDRQRLFSRVTVPVHPANLYLGIKPGKFFVNVGDSFQASIIALRPDGSRAAGLPVTAELVRKDWLNVERAGVSGRLEWVSEERNTTVSSFTYTTDAGTQSWTTALDHPGEYIFKVTGTDENHRATQSAISFYAMGGGNSWWAENDTDLIELLPEKKQYKPGETARILVKSPYAKARALVTLEREGVIAHWLTTVNGAGFIDVPITEKELPNVFVGVMLVQGRASDKLFSASGEDIGKPEAKFGYVNLSVSPAGRRLNVSIASDKLKYRPQEPVTVTVRTVDDEGKAMPSEVTVYAVDEGVLALTGYPTPDLFSEFYGPRSLEVDTADSRPHILGQRSYGEKGENRGGGGGGKGGLEGIDLRAHFVPTAYWNPSLHTDAQGVAHVTFRLPDNLSRFRLMAVAQTGHYFGSADSKLTVSKPLLLRPSLPRFARLGDTFKGGVVIHNYSDHVASGTLALELSGTGIELAGARQKEFQVDAGKAQEITWSCNAIGLGQTAFRFRARAGEDTDGLEWKVPVKETERLETEATSGVTKAQVTEGLNRPGDLAKHAGSVDISLSPTALAGLEEGARYLLEYPYGCLEQRMSRALPVVVGADLVQTFGLGSIADLKRDVQTQFGTLSDYQHPGGGFAYWPNAWRPDPYITAYTLEVAWLAQKEGYRLPKDVLDRAVAWLRTYLSSHEQWAYPYSESEEDAARAYALYVLALYHQAPGNYFLPLYERRDQLPFLAKAYLAKAAPLIMNTPEVRRTLTAELLNQARLTPTSLHFEEPAETRMPWIHESTVKTTAVVLQALLETQDGFPNDEKAVHWLMNERKDQGRWRSTQENADSLRVLQDYFRRYEKETPAFTAVVEPSTMKTPLWTERFQGRTLTARQKQFDIDTLFGSASALKLNLKKEGTGRLYYTLRMRYAPSGFEKATSEGFTIEKTVTPLYGSGKTLQAGSRAVVTLKIHTDQDRPFVALEDPLPGGFEIVDPSFAVEGQEDARTLEKRSEGNPDWGNFERSENYDDRILIFADFLSAGNHAYSYLVQATTPGSFHSPATHIEQMYEPEVFGRTASTQTKIQ